MNPPRTNRGRALLALLLVLTPGCPSASEEDVAPAPAAAAGEAPDGAQLPQPLQLVSGPRVPAAVVQRLLVPAGLAPWQTRAHDGEVLELERDGATVHALAFRASARTEVVIPGSFDASTFNQVAVQLATPRNFALDVELRHAGQTSGVASRGVHWERAAFESTVVFDMSALGTGVWDELVLKKSGLSSDWTVLAVELRDQPADQWLPTPEAGAELVRIAGEGRRGVGLSSRSPLSARVAVPESGVLSFSYALPETAQSRASAAELVVTVGAGTADARELPRAFPEAPGWAHASIDLSPWAGREVEVRFRLAVPEGDPLACVLAEAATYVPVANPRTVLLVTSDTHRGDHVGAAHSGLGIKTPTLDRLAETGIYFADCFSSTNVTVPSHTALLTGTHPRDTGVLDNNMCLTDRAVTLAELFHGAGFVTYASTSVAHLSPEMTGLGQGFDRMGWPWPDTSQTVATVAIDRVLSWLPDAEGRPLFVWLHVFDAHRPYEPPDAFAHLYYPEGKDPTALDPKLKGPGRRKRTFPVPPEPGLGSVRDIDWIYALYRGEVSFVDSELARVLEDPRLASGVIAVTADHGESLGQHDIYWNHYGMYPDTLHVPLFLRYPGGPEGVRVERSMRQIDIGKTLLELAGVGSAAFPGRELIYELASPEARDAPRFSGGPRYGLQSEGKGASLQMGRWFLTFVLKGGPKNGNPDWGVFEKHAVELYDLEADPKCEHDLAKVEPEQTKRMRALLVEWLGSAVDSGWAAEGPDTAETRALLDQLGYASGGEGVSATNLYDPECDCANCAAFR